MKVQSVVNGSVSLVLIPENEIDIQMLKALSEQNNDIDFINGGTQILGQTITQGLVIRKAKNELTNGIPTDESPKEEEEDLDTDETKEEDL